MFAALRYVSMQADQAPSFMPIRLLLFTLLLLVVGTYMKRLTCWLAISKWGVCKEGSGYRLQGKTNPGFLHHILLILKVNVDLHSKRPSMTWG